MGMKPRSTKPAAEWNLYAVVNLGTVSAAPGIGFSRKGALGVASNRVGRMLANHCPARAHNYRLVSVYADDGESVAVDQVDVGWKPA